MNGFFQGFPLVNLLIWGLYRSLHKFLARVLQRVDFVQSSFCLHELLLERALVWLQGLFTVCGAVHHLIAKGSIMLQVWCLAWDFAYFLLAWALLSYDTSWLGVVFYEVVARLNELPKAGLAVFVLFMVQYRCKIAASAAVSDIVSDYWWGRSKGLEKFHVVLFVFIVVLLTMIVIFLVFLTIFYCRSQILVWSKIFSVHFFVN